MDAHLAAKDELRRLLRRIAKRLGLNAAAIEIIGARSEIVTHGRSARICGPQTCADFVRILVQGAAKIVCRPERGKPFIVRFAAPGEFLCVPQPKKAAGYVIEIVAHDDVTLALLTRSHMLEAIAAMPVSGVGQLASWSFRAPTRLLFEKLLGRRLPLPARVAIELKDLARRFAWREDPGVVIDLDLSRQELADLTCASPARISDAMKKLRMQGLVDRLGRKIVVTDRLLEADHVGPRDEDD